MKNILIPSTLEQDTFFSVKAAVKHAGGTHCTITLLLLNEAPDAESASYFLRNTRQALTTAQQNVLENCRLAIGTAGNCTLDIHNQYGLSAPLLKNLMEYLAPKLIIIPASYKQEKAKIHHYFLELAANSKIPMLHLTVDCEEKEFNKALYVENTEAPIAISELQQHINGQFNFKIVSHATVGEKYPHELGEQLTDAISKNNIDLVIETRKSAKGGRKTQTSTINEVLGLPVLSIYEDAVI